MGSARLGVKFKLKLNKRPFNVAGTLTGVYQDTLAGMHHNHSTTLPVTSWHTGVNIIMLLVPYLPTTKCPNRTRFG